MVIVIIGPSGSGKDTQANFLVERYKIPNISTGRIIRDAIFSGGELGKEVNEYVSKGKWIPDNLIFRMLLQRLEQDDTKNGFIINGFPRTETQVELLDQIIKQRGEKLLGVIHFQLSEEEVIKRMVGQRGDGEDRPDMSEDAIRGRLDSYNETIAPILEKYSQRGVLIDVDAFPSIEEIKEVVREKIEQRI